MFSRLSFFVLLVSVLACCFQRALAVPYFTAPVGSTTTQGGAKLHVQWIDNGKAPALSDAAWGNSTIFLAAGSQNTQYKLQTLAQNVAPSRKGGHYVVDKTIGPSGQYYFIRMEGSQKDASGNPVMAFSARFTLNGMSGQFNSTVLSAAMGAQGPASGSSSGGSSSSSSIVVSRTTSAVTTPSSVSAAARTSTSSAGRLTINNNQSTTILAAFAATVLAAAGVMIVL